MKNVMNEFVALDVETSGTNIFENELLAISFVPFNDKIPSITLYLKHDVEKIKWGGRGAEFFEKYKQAYEDSALNVSEFCVSINEYMVSNFPEGATLVGHNVSFDYYFLKKAFSVGQQEMTNLISHRSVDTHSILMYLHLLNKIPKNYLASSEAFKLISNINDDSSTRHTSYEDSLLVKKLMLFLTNEKFKIKK